MGVGAADLRRWVGAFADTVVANEQLLTSLDSAIGDADHGGNMARGMKAVVAKLDADPPATPAALLKQVGMTLISTVGGASGPLYGTFFLRMAQSVGDADELDTAGVGAALRAGVAGVVARGKAEAGDKTMYDALAPAVDAYDAALGGGELAEALRAAADAAATGRDATTPLQARKGRASYLGERSVGHQDPGATSATFLIETAAATLPAP
ncbi:dihydroxyacetone kinase subunit DhaL [Pseudonocardia sp. TRM90224]|uniref:dihydroxyacetone kinase subunit DhaL n=1 Tax=Pseudonocardia sp. TRM90224 TaxID=2812678 RepID=UPI001E3576F0|nr:dihydroxyacetone kinase subunit DhaL [Pseudonocardia sp. TRM90224]